MPRVDSVRSANLRARFLERQLSTSAASRLQLVANLRESGPPRIGLAVDVLVRLEVEVLAADRTEPGAVLTAQDLVGELQRDCVARPCGKLNVILEDVVRAQLVPRRCVEVVKLARPHLASDLRMPEAAHARSAEPSVEPQFEHGCARGLRQLELNGNRGRRALVALPAEQEGLEIDVERLAAYLARTEPQPTEIDGCHTVSVTPDEERLLKISSPARLLPYDHGS